MFQVSIVPSPKFIQKLILMTCTYIYPEVG